MIRRLFGFSMFVIILAFVFRNIATAEIRQTFERDDKGTEPGYTSLADDLYSPHAILIRLSDQAVLMEKNSEDRVFPASLTKMMTAMVAIENLSNLEEVVQLTQDTFRGLYSANAALAGFQEGEAVKAIDLLYGVLLPSGAEAAVALADHIAGSERNFVAMMNRKAADLGMNNTHFENVTGLHDDNHYSTVKDLAVLLNYALRNDTYRTMFTSSRHDIRPTNKHPEGMTLRSTMFLKLPDRHIESGEILGGKTGYTSEAGLCLASLAVAGGEEYILVTAGAEGNQHTEPYHIKDAVTVYNRMVSAS